MAEELETPFSQPESTGAPKKNNTTLIVVVVLALLIVCCCCVLVVGAGLTYGLDFMRSIQINW